MRAQEVSFTRSSLERLLEFICRYDLIPLPSQMRSHVAQKYVDRSTEDAKVVAERYLDLLGIPVIVEINADNSNLHCQWVHAKYQISGAVCDSSSDGKLWLN